MERYLEGKVAIVTGSGQGVGRGIAIYLARQGAKVITNNRKPGSASCQMYKKDDMPEEEYNKMLSLKGDAESTARQIIEEGGEATPFYGDVSDYDTAGRMVKTAVDTYGRIDIIVNNAAGLGQGTIVNTTEADWDYMTLAKMKGAYNTMHHAVPYMIEQGFGRILNSASDAWTGMANLCAYSAANSGIVGLTKAAAKELANKGITVNAYCPQAASPGHVVEFNKTIRSLEKALGKNMNANPEKMKQVEKDHGPAENAAPFLAYLCTEEAAYISGAVFSVKASGKIDVYCEAERIKQISKEDEPWSVKELIDQVPSTLLEGYKSIANVNAWKG